jgi:predicted metal-dependent phosphotriesterase family hydrolase
VVAPTGLHHERHYHDRHWSAVLSIEEIAGLFVADVMEGIDANDYAGPVVRRTPYRAGVIKIAGDVDRLTPVEEQVFGAAAATHVRTGVPLLTHGEHGTAGPLQPATSSSGASIRPTSSSPTPTRWSTAATREIFATGAMVEYDRGFRRRPDQENGTLALLAWEDGFGDRIVLGMDAARRGCWTTHDGAPGMAWLLRDFAAAMTEGGIGPAEQTLLFVANPARAYAFAAPAA